MQSNLYASNCRVNSRTPVQSSTTWQGTVKCLQVAAAPPNDRLLHYTSHASQQVQASHTQDTRHI